MSHRGGAIARSAAGAAALAGVLWLVGTEPFVAAAGSLTTAGVAAAAVLTGVATTACGWRWSRVARGLAVDVGLGAAVRGCYRAQLLNLLLPGGVVGDLHRGLRHGRDTGRTARALRSVAWERTAGQAVQVGVLVVVLLVVPGRLPSAPGYAAAACLAVLGAALALRARWVRARASGFRLVAAVTADVRQGLLAPEAWPAVVAGSVVALAAHVATFVVAARSVGVVTPLVELVPLALLVLTAAALPVGLAGWGPREGAAVAVFAAAGLGAATGATVAAAYGLLVLATHLPALVLLVGGPVLTAPAPPVGQPAIGEVVR